MALAMLALNLPRSGLVQPALVIEDKPYRDLGEAKEAPEAEQRYRR